MTYQTNSGHHAVLVGGDMVMRGDVGPCMAKVLDALPTVCHEHAFELRERYSAQALHLVISQGALEPDLTSGRLVRVRRSKVVADYVCGGVLLALCLPFIVVYLLLFAASPTLDAVSLFALVQAIGLMFAALVVMHLTIEPQVRAAKMLANQEGDEDE